MTILYNFYKTRKKILCFLSIVCYNGHMKHLFKRIITATAALAFACIPAISATANAPAESSAITAKAASYFTTTPTGYTKASDVKYPSSGYISNWGARGEACVFLSSKALSFYTGNNTYEVFSQKSGGSTQSNASSSALYSTLKTFMKDKHKSETSYQGTRDLYKYTDCVYGTTKISSFYSGKEIGPSWDSGNTWNREHTWPNSKGLGGNDENDIMMLRPTWVQENSSRGNTAYGQSSGYFDPNCEGANVRGDCARIVLYVYTRWGNTSNMWGESGVMENMNVLLQWMEEDPVDTWEMGRNDAVQSITGTRNVFVDYPELAFLLFGKTAPKTMVTPSGIASDGTAVPTPPPVTPDEPDEPDTPVTPDIPNKPVGGALATFEFGENKSASHSDGNSATSKTYTANGYTLNITGGNQLYTEANDAKGNSCLKLGSSKNVGEFSFTVPDEVQSVMLKVAKYKTNASAFTANGKSFTVTSNSNDGRYEEFTVDTSSAKTVSISTVSGSSRIMIDSISFFGADEPDTPIVPDKPDKPDTPDTPSGGDSTECKHSFGEWTVLREPTETASGTKYRICSLCGGMERQTIPALSADGTTPDSEPNGNGGSANGDSAISGCAATVTAPMAFALLISTASLLKKKKD